MKVVLMSIVIASAMLVVPVAQAKSTKSHKGKVTNCSSYTYYTGTTKTTCRTKYH